MLWRIVQEQLVREGKGEGHAILDSTGILEEGEKGQRSSTLNSTARILEERVGGEGHSIVDSTGILEEEGGGGHSIVGPTGTLEEIGGSPERAGLKASP